MKENLENLKDAEKFTISSVARAMVDELGLYRSQ